MKLRKEEYEGYEIQYIEHNCLQVNEWGVHVFKIGESVSLSTLGQLNSIQQGKTFIRNLSYRRKPC